MKKIKILSLLAAALIVFAACSETEDTPEFGNWEKRNTQYIDSIAQVARANADGNWKTFLAIGLDESKEWGNEYHVYCKVLQAGDGTASPAYTDYVSVNYSGRLIPSATYPQGYIFDSSYEGELDPSFDVPAEFQLSGTVRGFSTAIQHMVAGTTKASGDIWRVYIPAELGYGAIESSGIPAYSALIFDINLVSFSQSATTE